MPFDTMAKVQVTVNLANDQGPLELWRQAIGHGGINSHPIPARVVEGLAKLRPRLTRIFIQEFFNIYPDHGRFDWSRLDPYMDALEKTVGAKVVAAITIKPKPLFPQIDPTIWRPNDVAEWQHLIAALVQRYSVDRKLVTYWEIGNETDIGEHGGCPYLIVDPAEYAEYYAMTIQPILATFPQSRVGGPAVANGEGALLTGFIDICRRDGLQLDFVSWHLYNDDPERHAALVNHYQQLLADFGGHRPEMLVTEWNKGFDPVSVEELAFEPRRPAIAAACILAMNEAKVDWSFYYHAWDQVSHNEEFAPFFKDPGIMHRHWNEIPHRFGLFGVNEEVRPQYFVYQMLSRMGDRRIEASSSSVDMHVLASRAESACSVLLVNHGRQGSVDQIATLQFHGMAPGGWTLAVYRIHGREGWSPSPLEPPEVEWRAVDVGKTFAFQLYCPAESVCLAVLTAGGEPKGTPSMAQISVA